MSIDWLVAGGPAGEQRRQIVALARRRAADRWDQAADQNEFSAKTQLMITGPYRGLWLIYV